MLLPLGANRTDEFERIGKLFLRGLKQHFFFQISKNKKKIKIYFKSSFKINSNLKNRARRGTIKVRRTIHQIITILKFSLKRTKKKVFINEIGLLINFEWRQVHSGRVDDTVSVFRFRVKFPSKRNHRADLWPLIELNFQLLKSSNRHRRAVEPSWKW